MKAIVQIEFGILGFFAATNIKSGPASQQLHFLQGYRVAGEKERTYIVQCSAIARDNGWTVHDTAVSFVAFIHDPAIIQQPDSSLLQHMFGLTAMQAKVALALTASSSYKEVARSMNIGLETLRTHIKDIYPKAKVNRHVDLVRVILSLLAMGCNQSPGLVGHPSLP